MAPDLFERGSNTSSTGTAPGPAAAPGAKAADLVRLSIRVPQVAQRLVWLRQALPTANLAAMVARSPRLLLRDTLQDDLAAAMQLLHMCPPMQREALLEAMPQLLEPGALAGVLAELQRLFGGTAAQAARLLADDPGLALSCQSLQGQSRGERDAGYLGDIFGAGGNR